MITSYAGENIKNALLEYAPDLSDNQAAELVSYIEVNALDISEELANYIGNGEVVGGGAT